MRFRDQPAYSFDDVLLVPRRSEVESRKDIDLSTKLGEMTLDFPILSSNMDTVTDVEMASTMSEYGGAGVLHRFTSDKEISGWVARLYGEHARCIISVGVNRNEESLELIQRLRDRYRLDAVCVDVAHGHSVKAFNTVETIRGRFPDLDIIAGNVATGEGAVDLYHAGATIIKVGIGPGCHAAGTRILMANGIYKNIKNVVSGDRVINMNGKSSIVKRSFSTGVRDVISIRNSIWGDDTLVTPDHKYYVGDLTTTSSSTVSSKGYTAVLSQQSKTKPKQDKIGWKSIGEGDCALLMPRHIQFEMPNEFCIDIPHRTQGVTTLLPSYDVGYIFGTFLGDGNTHHCDENNTGSVHWCFGKDEIAIAQKLADAIFTVFDRDCKIKRRDNTILVHFYHKPFADFLKCFGKRSLKHLPSEYLVANRDYLSGMLRGLLDSDGHKEKCGRYKFTNTSQQLTELFGVIHYLLNGIWPNVQYREPSIGGLIHCTIANCLPSRVSSILVSGEKRLLPDYQVSKLLEKTDVVGRCEVFDLEIDDPTHSFIANNTIVHNSVCSTRVVTGHGFPQLSAIGDVVQALNGNASVIADGGIRYPGDIVKALAAGADTVMLGSLLAGTSESPGYVFVEHKHAFKAYRGSASRAAQDNPKSARVEGVSAQIPFRGPVEWTLNNIRDGLRSGYSYSGAHNIDDLQRNAEFQVVTANTVRESHPHHPYVL